MLHVLGALRGVSHHLTGGGHVIEQAAGGSVRGVNRAQETPGLGEKLPHGCRAQLSEIGAPVNRPEVGQVPAAATSTPNLRRLPSNAFFP